jgi:hypothetical protein
VLRVKDMLAAGVQDTVDAQSAATGRQERWSARSKLAMNSATGFLIDFSGLRPVCREREDEMRAAGLPT